MKSFWTHGGFFLLGVALAALALVQIWPTEPCAKVSAMIDQRVESWQAFEAKAHAEKDGYIASLTELLAFSRQVNKELATSRDALALKLKQAQPVVQKLTSIEQEVQSIKALAAQRTPLHNQIQQEAKGAGHESFTVPWWKQQALRLAAGRW